MMKKGFTLVELTAVIILIGLISVLAITAITKSINNKKNEISDAMQRLINSAADVYMGYDPIKYSKQSGNVYCIKLKDLVDAETLQSPIKDPINGNVISEDKYVKVEVNVDDYLYSLVDTCTEKR